MTNLSHSSEAPPSLQKQADASTTLFVDEMGQASPFLPGESIFPETLPIPRNADYNKPAYFDDPHTLLLQEDRLRNWLEFHAKPWIEEAQRQTDLYNAGVKEAYLHLVEVTEKANRNIELRNQARLEQFKADYADYQKARDTFCLRDPEIVVSHINERMKQAIEGQRAEITARMEKLLRTCHDEATSGKSLSLWVIALFACIITAAVAPLYSSIPGVVVALAFFAMQKDAKKRVESARSYSRDEYVLEWNHRWLDENASIDNTNAFTLPIRLRDSQQGQREEGWVRLEYVCSPHLKAEGLIQYRRAWLLGSCIPGVSAFLVVWSILWVIGGYFPLCEEAVSKTVDHLKEEAWRMIRESLRGQGGLDSLAGKQLAPVPPAQPVYEQYHAVSPMQEPLVVSQPQPPDDCFDNEPERQLKKILQGADLFNLETQLPAARQLLFRDGALQRYYHLGGLPMTFPPGQIPHILLVGQSGSGKTTMLMSLLSWFLPLSRRQMQNVFQRTLVDGTRLPSSSYEWCRAATHQAVVYNAKDEMVPYLSAFGFDCEAGPESDLIILDPKDERCFAWDLAADINDRDSITKFAELMVPMPKDVASQNSSNKVWQDLARSLITAVIVSFRNAALANGLQPAWNLWDLCVVIGSEERIWEVLGYHDTPRDERGKYFNKSSAQLTSVTLTAQSYVGSFRTTAERWREADRMGRKISLKEWAKSRPGTVLVLPNTADNATVNGPLNNAIVKCLADLIVTKEYSKYVDDKGCEQVRKRYIVIDEVGEAGHITSLQPLLTQGRSFGVTVILGLHQLSQMDLSYGADERKSIINQCAYKVLLKQEDIDTMEWMSKLVGEQTVELDKITHNTMTSTMETIGTTSNISDGAIAGKNASWSTADQTGNSTQTGSTWSRSSGPGAGPASVGGSDGTGTQTSRTENIGGGTMEQTSHVEQTGVSSSTQTGSQEGVSKGVERRKDFLFYPSEFRTLPDPTTTGRIGMILLVPSLAPWRVDISFAAIEPHYESREKLKTVEPVVKWRNDEAVSKHKTWTSPDYVRLTMNLLVHDENQELLEVRSSSVVVQGQLAHLTGESPFAAGQEVPASRAFPSEFEFEDE